MRIAALLLGLLPLSAQGADIQLMIDRSEQGVEFFVKFNTEATETVLAPFPAGFLDEEGLVDIGPFRSGTADHGDALWAGVTTTIGQDAALVEAMSMMVHPDSLPVPYNDPIDAFMATAICNVTDPDARFAVGVLSTYAGFIAWDVEGYGPVELQFPEDIEVEVTEFVEGRKISHQIAQVGPQAPLALDSVSRWERIRFW
ncbi:MAG: hypothetical protein AAGI10_03720 [Pseudomonadota bacterium]